MTRCSCGAFLEEQVLTRLTPAERKNKNPPRTPHDKQKTQTRQREQDKTKRTETTHATKQRTRRPTNKQTKHRQKQRQTRDREGDPAQPLLLPEKPGVLQQKETTTNTKNVTQPKEPEQRHKQQKRARRANYKKEQETKQDPCRSKVWQSPNPKGRKRIPTAPLLSYNHPPDPRKESGGTGYRQEGGRRDPFPHPRDKIELEQKAKIKKKTRQKEEDEDVRRTEGPPDPLQITQGQDQQWILTPESKCNGPGGRQRN